MLAKKIAKVGAVMPKVGDRVADLTFLRTDGNEVRLSDFPRPLLLVFLRHIH